MVEFIGVAIKQKDLVIALPKPNRHHDILKHMVFTLGLTPPCGNGPETSQGFYAADGRYYDRFEARQMAIDSGQCAKPIRDYALFSEDLW